MKLKMKYYLRGLGLGIVVTAVIMCILESKDNKMTNEEIMARAKQLGMIESTMLIESSPREDNDVQGTDNNQSEDISESGDVEGQSQTDGDVTGTGAQANANVSAPGIQLNASTLLPDAWANNGAADDSAQGIQSDTDENEDIAPDTQSDADVTEVGTQDTPETASEFPKVLIISSGEGSYTVSKRLAELGAVESAADFDNYLCEHGYDKKIRAGTYTIPVGATDEQMAKIVTGAKVTE